MNNAHFVTTVIRKGFPIVILMCKFFLGGDAVGTGGVNAMNTEARLQHE